MSGDILYCFVQPTVEVAESWGVRVLKRMDYIYVSKFVYLLDIDSSEAFKKEGVTNDNFKVYMVFSTHWTLVFAICYVSTKHWRSQYQKPRVGKGRWTLALFQPRSKFSKLYWRTEHSLVAVSALNETIQSLPAVFQTWLPASMLTTFQQVKRVSIPCLCLSKDDTIRTEDVTGIIRPLLFSGSAGSSSKKKGKMVYMDFIT